MCVYIYNIDARRFPPPPPPPHPKHYLWKTICNMLGWRRGCTDLNMSVSLHGWSPLPVSSATSDEGTLSPNKQQREGVLRDGCIYDTRSLWSLNSTHNAYREPCTAIAMQTSAFVFRLPALPSRVSTPNCRWLMNIHYSSIGLLWCVWSYHWSDITRLWVNRLAASNWSVKTQVLKYCISLHCFDMKNGVIRTNPHQCAKPWQCFKAV